MLRWPLKRLFGAEGPSGDSGLDHLGTAAAEAFAEESLAGFKLTVIGRILTLLAIAILLPFIAPYPDFLFYHALVLVLALLGFAQLGVARYKGIRSPLTALLISFDFVVLAFGLIYPSPIGDQSDLLQEVLQSSNFKYLFVLLVPLAMSYQPGVVLLGGFVGSLAWLVGNLWLYRIIDRAIGELDRSADGAGALVLPTSAFLSSGEWLESRIEEAIVFLIAAALLAAAVQRFRRLLIGQVKLARERRNLARHFAPALVDSLARRDLPFKRGQETVASVLFADLVGFTGWAQGRASNEVIDLLRDVHARFESAIFEWAGTLNKFIGDGVMATFGAPDRRPSDAANALCCAVALLDDFDRWNDARSAAGLERIDVAIGIETGPVVIGDVGSQRQLELAVLGDTVNTASRLEKATRALGCRLAVSEATVEAARTTLVEAEAVDLLSALRRHGLVQLRGRDEGIVVWTR